MSLDVGSVLELDVLVEVDGRADDNFPRAEDVGDAVASGKAVEPKNAQVYELSDHATWQFLERQNVVDASGAILNGSDLSLSFRHVFASFNGVEGHTCSGKVITKDFELSIHKNKLGNKPAYPVDVADSLDGRKQSFLFLVEDELGCTEFDFPRYGDHEWQFINEHNIGSDDDVMVT